MMLNILRGLFVLLMASVGWAFAVAEPEQAGALQKNQWLAPAVALITGVALICIDILAGRRKFAVFTGVAFGILIGLTITYALSFGVQLVVDTISPQGVNQGVNKGVITFINLMIGLAACYFAVSFILQTKDDFRFIIPYVEFRRDARGSRPIILDTSVLIDGRIAQLAATGFLDSQLVVPQYVVRELQEVADSRDRLKRARGRRGLDILNRLKDDPSLNVRMFDSAAADEKDTPVDQRLINLALELDGRAMTTDFNLNKVAQLAGVPVLNLNELSNSLRSEVLPGEVIRVLIVKPGTAEAQGVGYLDDGTMVVVEHGRDQMDREVDLVVTNTTQTAAGRMVFGRAITKGALGSNGNGQTDEHQGRPGRLLGHSAGPEGAQSPPPAQAQDRSSGHAGKSAPTAS